MSNQDCEVQLAVGEVGWSQDSIAGTFRDGGDIRVMINELRQMSLESRIQLVREFPPIRVVQFEDQGWITLDNRRLHIFRSILPPGTQITARIATLAEAQELRRKLTTRDEGATIAVRANRRR